MLKIPGLKKYAKNTSWMFFERIIRVLVVFAVGIPVTRYLGDVQFGELNYAMGWVGLFLSMSTLGLEEIVVRDLVRNPHKRDELLGTSFLLRSGGATLMVLVVTLLSMLRGNADLTVTMVFIIAFAEVFRGSSVINQYYLSRVEASKTVKVQMVQVLVSAGFKLALVFLQAPLVWFAMAVLVETVVLGVGYVFVYKADGLFVKQWKASFSMSKYLMSQAWPLIIFGLALFVQARVDQVMIGDILTNVYGKEVGDREVGQYSVALKMIEALGFIPVVLQKSLAPAITGAKDKSNALYRDRLLNQYRLMFLMFLVTAVPLYFLAEPIIVLLYGEEFRPAGFLLSLFAIRLFFTNMGVGKTSFITNESLFRYSLLTAVVGATINIGMNYFLIETFRAKGAIIATIGSFTVSIFLLDLFFKNTRWNFKLMMLGMLTFWKVHRVK